MMRIAIVGGGIAGLAAAYELECARKQGADVDWRLYESAPRVGGIIHTTRRTTSEGEFLLEDGPDGWVSEKPWARELAVELGMESELLPCMEASRRTYVLLGGTLVPIPEHMRMMVPEDLTALDNSSLFSAEAKWAYAEELTCAGQLRASAPADDESVASFVRRHFGDEVLEKIGAPLLSGVFGGDVHKLSVRAVMPAFVAMEREYGSLILAMQKKLAARGKAPRQPVFTTLRRGMGSLIEALTANLPAERVHCRTRVRELFPEDGDGAQWTLLWDEEDQARKMSHSRISTPFDHLILATSLDTTHSLLRELDPEQTAQLRNQHNLLPLLPSEASSSVLVSFCWTADAATSFTLPPGFGFLVPQNAGTAEDEPKLLAATFVDQKYPGRAPAGARIVRVFFGTQGENHFGQASDDSVAAAAFTRLKTILGPLPKPEPALTLVRRWPRSLPQYGVGHVDRIATLREMAERINLTLLGNAYSGVGIPDLIHDARQAVQKMLAERA